MAWTAATANYTEKRTNRGAVQRDTIGEIFTKTFKVSFGASANTDSIELTGCKIPAGTAILSCIATTANSANGVAANAPANSGVALKLTTGNKEFANAANNLSTGAVGTVLTLVAANTISLVDDTITITQVGSANAVGALTATFTLTMTSIGGVDSPYSTFTL